MLPGTSGSSVARLSAASTRTAPVSGSATPNARATQSDGRHLDELLGQREAGARPPPRDGERSGRKRLAHRHEQSRGALGEQPRRERGRDGSERHATTIRPQEQRAHAAQQPLRATLHPRWQRRGGRSHAHHHHLGEAHQQLVHRQHRERRRPRQPRDRDEEVDARGLADEHRRGVEHRGGHRHAPRACARRRPGRDGGASRNHWTRPQRQDGQKQSSASAIQMGARTASSARIAGEAQPSSAITTSAATTARATTREHPPRGGSTPRRSRGRRRGRLQLAHREEAARRALEELITSRRHWSATSPVRNRQSYRRSSCGEIDELPGMHEQHDRIGERGEPRIADEGGQPQHRGGHRRRECASASWGCAAHDTITCTSRATNRA